MRETSAALRIVVLIVFLPLGLLALAGGEVLVAIGSFMFAGIGFAGLSFSGIDPTCADPRSRKWFLASMGFGAIGSLVLAIYFIQELANGDTKRALRHGGALLGLGCVLWRYRRDLLAIVNRKTIAPESPDRQAPP